MGSNMPILMLLLLVFWGVSASAEKADLGKVDAILDRLEKRLLDQESESLTYGEKKRTPSKDALEKAPVASYKFSKSTVEAKVENEDKLKAINTLINELEGQIDQLASNVQKTKQSIQEEASIDNFVTLEASLSNTDTAALRSLIVKVDGFKLYEIDDAAGLWLPSKAIPLYAGPMQPGNHLIELEARISMRQQRSMPMAGAVYRFVNKSFQWTVPGGSATPRYVIAITPPNTLDGGVDAKLEDAS